MTQHELKTEAGPKRTTHRPPFPATCSSPRVFSLSSAEHSESLCPPQWIASLLPRSLSSRSLAPLSPCPLFPKMQGAESYHNAPLSHKTCISQRGHLLSAIETGLQSRWVVNAG